MCRLGPPVILVFAFSFAFVPSAWAARNDAIRSGAKDRAAHEACLSGNVQKGIEILSSLYVRTMDAVFLYNQGRCFEQNGRCQDAIPRFQEYLRKAKNASGQEKSDAEKHIADCQASIGQQPQQVPVALAEGSPLSPPTPTPVSPLPPPLPAPSPTAPPTDASPKTPDQLVTSPTSVSTEHPGRGLRFAGIAFGVVGIGSIATGVYFYAMARSYSDKVSRQDVPDPSDLSAGRNAETMQWVFYSVGGAALATGVVLYTLGHMTADGQTKVSIAPFAGSGAAGISAQGAF